MPKASANIASKADAHFDPTEYVDLMVDLGALPASWQGRGIEADDPCYRCRQCRLQGPPREVTAPQRPRS